MDVLHTSFFCTISNFNSLLPPTNKNIYSLLVLVGILFPQPVLQEPRLHFLNFSHGLRLWGLQKGRNLRQQDLGCRVCADEEPNQVLWLFPVFSDLYVSVRSIEGRFQQNFWWVRTLNCLTTLREVHKNHPLGISKQSGHYYPRSRGNLKLLFPRKSLVMPLHCLLSAVRT